MPNYNAVIGRRTLTLDRQFQGPITVPDDFVGVHQNSIAHGVYPVTTQAVLSVALDADKKPVVTVVNQGAGYTNGNATQWWVAAKFNGGDPRTKQAKGYPIIDAGKVTGVVVTDPGDYQSQAPTCSIVTTGGANIPALPDYVNAVRGHAYMGSGSTTFPRTGRPDLVGVNNYYTMWYGIDNGSGLGDYNFSMLDELVLMMGAMGKRYTHLIYGTPQAYATTIEYTNVSYDNYKGGSAPLNALGLTIGTPNVGLDGFVKALVTRYNVNAHLLTNPITGQKFPAGTRLIHALDVGNEPRFGANGVSVGLVNGEYWIGTARELVDWVRIVSNAAKALDPQMKVYGCGFVAAFPMGAGTSMYNHFGNFLQATDSVEGKTGLQWVDGVGIHPYDFLEKGSRNIRPNCYSLAVMLSNVKRTLATLGAPNKPILVTECGFLDVKNVFQERALRNTETDQVLNMIQLRRMYCEMALHGVIQAFGFGIENIYMGHPTRTKYGYQMFDDICKGLNGKTITEVRRGDIGDIHLTFSDGSTYYTQ